MHKTLILFNIATKLLSFVRQTANGYICMSYDPWSSQNPFGGDRSAIFVEWFAVFSLHEVQQCHLTWSLSMSNTLAKSVHACFWRVLAWKITQELLVKKYDGSEMLRERAERTTRYDMTSLAHNKAKDWVLSKYIFFVFVFWIRSLVFFPFYNLITNKLVR